MTGKSSVRLATSRSVATVVSFVVAVVSLMVFPNPPQALALAQVKGSLDSITASGEGYLRLQGWAASPDYPTTRLGIRAKIGTEHLLVSYKIGNIYRPDVPAAIGPQYSSNLGFDINLPTKWGSTTVCIEALNGSTWQNVPGACKSYTINEFSPDGFRRFSGGNYVAAPGDLVSTSYSVSTPVFLSAIQQAADSYTSSDTKVDLVYTPFASSSTSAVTVANYPNETFIGLTTKTPCSTGGNQTKLECGYGTAAIQLNLRYISTASYMKEVAVHEFGHSLGLGHAPQAYVSGMNATSTIPSYYDIQSLSMLYPLNAFGH